jgi:hypothetical protein
MKKANKKTVITTTENSVARMPTLSKVNKKKVFIKE